MMRKRFRRLFALIWQYTPVTRKRMKREVAKVRALQSQQRQFLLQRHEREMEEATKHAHAIVDRLFRTGFYREPQCIYSLVVKFDVQMMGVAPQDELLFIAQRVGQQVEREIATSKFVHSTAEAERDLEMRRRHGSW